jgi:hypothetical protein
MKVPIEFHVLDEVPVQSHLYHKYRSVYKTNETKRKEIARIRSSIGPDTRLTHLLQSRKTVSCAKNMPLSRSRLKYNLEGTAW